MCSGGIATVISALVSEHSVLVLHLKGIYADLKDVRGMPRRMTDLLMWKNNQVNGGGLPLAHLSRHPIGTVVELEMKACRYDAAWLMLHGRAANLAQLFPSTFFG